MNDTATPESYIFRYEHEGMTYFFWWRYALNEPGWTATTFSEREWHIHEIDHVFRLGALLHFGLQAVESLIPFASALKLSPADFVKLRRELEKRPDQEGELQPRSCTQYGGGNLAEFTY